VSAAENWKAVNGASLRALLPGNEFGDDGTFAGTEMGKDVRGKWRVAAEEICRTWTRPPNAEQCYTVDKDGVAVRMLRNGSEAWYGTLKPAKQSTLR
jgi:hypothetical protein